MKKKKAPQRQKPKPMSVGQGGKEFFVLPHEGEVTLYHRLFEDVRLFLLERHLDPVQEAFDIFSKTNRFELSDVNEEDFDDPRFVQFSDWLIHTPGLIKTDRTGIELYLEKNKRLSEVERSLLNKMNDSLMTLCEMGVGKSNDRVIFTDLLFGNQFEVPVDEGMPPFPEGLLAAVRVIPFTAGPALGIGSYPFITDKETLLELIQEFFEEYNRDVPGSTMESFLKAENTLIFLWFEYMRSMWEDEDEEEDDEEAGEGLGVTAYLAQFEVSNSSEVRKRLKTIGGLEECQKDTFEWWGYSEEDGENTLRGVLVHANGKIAFTALSEELREAGKIMLLSSCRGLIRHTHDTMEKMGG